MKLGWEPGNDKQTMLFVFPSLVTMVKSHEKKLFSCYYDHYGRYGEMSPKC